MDPACLSCKTSDETVAHFLLDCITLESIRQPILKDIKHILRNRALDHNDRETLLQLLINCTAMVATKIVSEVIYHIRTIYDDCVTHCTSRDIKGFPWCHVETEVEKLNLVQYKTFDCK